VASSWSSCLLRVRFQSISSVGSATTTTGSTSASAADATTGSVDFSGSFSVCFVDDNIGKGVETGSITGEAGDAGGAEETNEAGTASATSATIFTSFGLFFPKIQNDK